MLFLVRIQRFGGQSGNLLDVSIDPLAKECQGGGIAPRILPWLARPPFLAAFLAKGRLRPLLEDVPVHVILDDRAALVGAARRATESVR